MYKKYVDNIATSLPRTAEPSSAACAGMERPAGILLQGRHVQALMLRRLSLNLKFLDGSTALKANLHLTHLWWAQKGFSLYAGHSCIRDKCHGGSKRQVKRLERRLLAGGKEPYCSVLEALTKLPNCRFTFKLHSVTMCRTQQFAKIYKLLLARLSFSAWVCVCYCMTDRCTYLSHALEKAQSRKTSQAEAKGHKLFFWCVLGSP